MRKWVENLLAVQDVDMRIRQLNLKLEMLPKEKEKLSSALENEQSAIKDNKTKIQKTEMELKQLESAVKKLNEDAIKLQNQSIMVKKNEEYKALLSEIDKCKNKIGDIETDVLICMDKLDAEKIEQKNHEKLFAERTKSINGELKELDQLAAELKEEIARIKESRAALANNVEAAILEDYTRLLNGKRGAPLAKVHQDICGNCHLKLTPQTMNLARKGAIARCDNCSHIIYMEDAQ